MVDDAEALRAAVRRADHPAVQQLVVDYRGSIDAPDEEFENTALHWAVIGGYLEIVVTLLTAGANPNKRNRNGVTALWLANDFGLSDIATQLVSHGARL
jgi:ankyrin repeat protein